jgi:hypothetical protein
MPDHLPRAGTPEKPPGYAEAAELNPTRYIDPNDAERRKAEKEQEKPGDRHDNLW